MGWKVLPQFTVDASLRGVGSLYVSDDMAHQDYVLLDTKFTYKPFRFLEVFVTLDNMANARYTINRGYEMPGFTAMGGLKLSFF